MWVDLVLIMLSSLGMVLGEIVSNLLDIYRLYIFLIITNLIIIIV